MESPQDRAGPDAAAAAWKRFSTARIPAGLRVEYWEEHNTKALIGLDIRTLEGGALQAEELNVYFPSLRFASVRGSSQIVERSQRLIARHPTGDIAIFFALGGEAFFYHADGMLLLRRGQAVLYDADLPFVRGFSHGVREFVLTLPREEFMRLSHGAPLREPLVFDFAAGDGGAVGDAAATSLASLIDEVFIHPPADLVPVEQEAFGLLEQLVARALGTDQNSAHRRALQAIERGFSHTGLTRAAVAREAGVSERQLARLFARQGRSFAEVVASHRLRRAESLLVSGPSMSIAEIARRCGFSTASSFSRAFRAHAGVTPSEVQRASAAQGD
ncbi:helix-turn-helix transcriptional regulator [Citricoccus sp. NPDC055426]|uniref:AraC family transcriptional regulator n=1 Tax=Citricoccus sp. NPDC055426 TaxID=3155536 RepID=UPI00341B626E